MITPLVAAHLCQRAYSDRPTIEAGDAHVLIEVVDGIVYPAFRGSVTALDWYEDLGAFPTPGIYGTVDIGSVHPMFFGDACAVFSLILDAAAGRPTWPLGHSKGGGEAELFAALLEAIHPGQLAGYTTLGKPKTRAVGNEKMIALLYGKPGNDFRNGRDPVPLVPEGFSHTRPTTIIGARPFVLDINVFSDHFLRCYESALSLMVPPAAA